MSASERLPTAVLKRKAVVYVRQSTSAQVHGNLESQRRQYELADVARQHGFRAVEIIDDDLGLSASGAVARPGFERLVAWLCSGEVGAVLCFDASRLARNGRDWHHLLELCGLVEARVIDHDGIYEARSKEQADAPHLSRVRRAEQLVDFKGVRKCSYRCGNPLARKLCGSKCGTGSDAVLWEQMWDEAPSRTDISARAPARRSPPTPA